MIGWQVKAIAAAVVLAIIGGLITVQHFTQKKLNATRHEIASANATIEAERKARAHEKEIADAAIKDLDQRRADLEAARADTPTRVVRLCRSANPAVPTTPGAALGADAGTAGEQPAEAGRDVEIGPDIGAALYAQADDNDQRAAQCNALIRWVRSR